MIKVLPIKAEIRDKVGTGASRSLRSKGMVPAIIYGGNKSPLSIVIEEKELTKHYRKPQYISQVIEFHIREKTIIALPKSIDLHPITEKVCHADFVFLEKQIQKMELPILYVNKSNCIGVKRGGYFNTIKRSLIFSCLVDVLPRKIEVDVTNMQISTSLRAKNIILPKGVQLLDNPELVIASIIGKKGKATDIDDDANKENTEDNKLNDKVKK